MVLWDWHLQSLNLFDQRLPHKFVDQKDDNRKHEKYLRCYSVRIERSPLLALLYFRRQDHLWLLLAKKPSDNSFDTDAFVKLPVVGI